MTPPFQPDRPLTGAATGASSVPPTPNRPTDSRTGEPGGERSPAASPVPRRAAAGGDALGRRVVSAIIALACLGLLTVAWLLDPAPEGHGTHEQMGLPTCSWVAAFNRPCATCGMTTAFAHAAEGRFDESFRAQPMGLLLALLTASGFWTSAYVAWTGSNLWRIFGTLLGWRWVWILAGAWALAWIYKVVTW